MRVIIIDDEILALNFMEHQLGKIPDIEILGKFVDPFAGLESVLQENADVVFLDIQLGEISGIELAERILERKPESNIVFVTAYDSYAVKAFDLNAMDYVLKPVGVERLWKTIRRIRERSGTADTHVLPSTGQKIQMKLFQQVLIETGEEQFSPIRWRTARAQELFLYLLQHRGQLVRKSALIDLLWPEIEPARAYAQLYTAVYHIRKTLEPMSAYFQLSNAMDSYTLNTKNVYLDVEEFESCLLAGQPLTEETIDDYEAVMELYAGDYLQEFEYYWAESERHRLKMHGSVPPFRSRTIIVPAANMKRRFKSIWRSAIGTRRRRRPIFP